jgi:fused signal recognition particle receptor
MFKLSLEKLKAGLAKTKENLLGKISQTIGLHKKIDEELLAELDEILIKADVGVKTAGEIISGIKKKAKERNLSESDKITELLKEEINQILQGSQITSPALSDEKKPWVIMIVGVNGTGKTTSIGKLAKLYVDEGKKVLIAACDTFRAAAIDQLSIWAERVGVNIIKSQPNADPAAVAFDAVKSAQAKGMDVVIVDTAGRLHTKVNLMEELKKIKRVMGKCVENAPQEILLVLDATTGQNGLSQVKLFDEAIGITGIILTKLDGTAKGGIIIAIANEQKKSVKYVGVGEKIDDLQKFDLNDFSEALFL